MNRINVELTGAERKAALCQLLEQETQLIASVGRHKLEADAGNQNIVVQKFLDKVGPEVPCENFLIRFFFNNKICNLNK